MKKKPIHKNVPLLDFAEQGDAVLLLFEVFDDIFGIHSHVPDVNYENSICFVFIPIDNLEVFSEYYTSVFIWHVF